MKFILAIVSTFIGFVAIRPLESASYCVVDTSRCAANAPPVCGRYGRSNLCMRFSNRCALQLRNCSNTGIGYTAVDISRCNGIAINQRRSCVGASSSTSNTSVNGILSNIFGSNTNIRPIVIGTGK